MPEDTAVAVAEPVAPSAPAEIVAPPQPDASPPASEGEPAPAETGEPGPEPEPEFSLDDETVDALFEVGGEKLLEHPKLKERLDREAQSIADRKFAERSGSVDHDAEYQRNLAGWNQAAQTREQALNQVVPLVRQAIAGEEVDVRALGNLVAQTLDAAQGAERAAISAIAQANRVTVAATLNDLFATAGDTVIGKTGSGGPLTLNAAYDNAMRAYDSQVANKDPRAGTELVKRAITMARETALAEGRKQGEEAALKKDAAKLRLATDAAIKEVKAKAAAKSLGQTAPVTTGVSAGSRHSWAEIQKMDKKALDALPPGEWERALNEG